MDDRELLARVRAMEDVIMYLLGKDIAEHPNSNDELVDNIQAVMALISAESKAAKADPEFAALRSKHSNRLLEGARRQAAILR